jgi:hypothetical protein
MTPASQRLKVGKQITTSICVIFIIYSLWLPWLCRLHVDGLPQAVAQGVRQNKQPGKMEQTVRYINPKHLPSGRHTQHQLSGCTIAPLTTA